MSNGLVLAEDSPTMVMHTIQGSGQAYDSRPRKEGSSHVLETDPSLGYKSRAVAHPIMLHTFLYFLHVMAPVKSAQGLCIHPTRDAHARILLWMMEVKTADIQTKGKQIQEQEEVPESAESGSAGSRRLSRGRMSGVQLFDEAEGIGSEESKTLSHGRRMSEASDGPDTSQ